MRYTALYGRQSLDVKDSLSVPMQLEKARAECAGDDVCKEYSDKGFSGKNTKRPGFIQLMNDIENDLVRRVIVYKLDRFSRSILDFAEAWNIMERHHVEFLSVNEKFDTSTPMGKAMLFILMVFAQMERETISERVTDNYYERAKYGSWLGGPAPYGMSLCRKVDSGGRSRPSLMYNETMDILEQGFYEYAQNPRISLGQLAKVFREKDGGVWNNVTLSRLFRNPVYVQADVDVYRYLQSKGVKILQDLECFDGSSAGMLISKRSAKNRQRRSIEGWVFTLANWEGRIPSEIWLKCQDKLTRNRQLGRAGAGMHSWLSGIVKCGHCGRAMVVNCYLDERYFHCSGRRNRICSKELETIYVKDIEESVEKELIKVIEHCGDEPYILEVEQNVEHKRKLAKIEEAIDNLIDFISSGQASGESREIINSRLTELSKQRDHWREEEYAKVSRERIKLQKIDFATLDLVRKKEVAMTYLQKVIIYQKNSIELIWNI